MSASRKKVVVRLLNGQLHHGYLPASSLLTGDELELLLPDGRVASIAAVEVKHIAYVRDFNLDDADDPERMGPRTLSTKPRGSGLWVRVHFVGGDVLEGLVHAGLSLMDGLLLDRGVFLNITNKHSNTQRVFVPRSAMSDFQVLGAAGTLPRGGRPAEPTPTSQGGLFDLAAEE